MAKSKDKKNESGNKDQNKKPARRGILPGDKVVNRTGGGRPQPSRVTSVKKIEALQSRLLARQLSFLGITERDNDYDSLRAVEVLTALNGQTDDSHVADPGYTPSREVQEAFYYSAHDTDAHKAINADGSPAVPGVHAWFFVRFRPDKELVKQIADEAHARHEARSKAMVDAGFAALGVFNHSLAYALVEAGIAPKPKAPKKAPTQEAKAATKKVAEAVSA